MNEADMFKVALTLDEDASIDDFNELSDKEFDNSEFIEEIKSSKKFNEKQSDVLRNKKLQNSNESLKNANKKCKTTHKNADFKKQYFSYYDDVKISSNDIEW